MIGHRLLCFVCRAVRIDNARRWTLSPLLPLIAWLAMIPAAGCSTQESPAGVEHPGEASTQFAPVSSRPRPQDAMPLDSYASAMIPRWFLPGSGEDQPAFTPHWYTPSVDPLFRRRLTRNAPGRPLPPSGAGSATETRPDSAQSATMESAGLIEAPKDVHVMEPHLEGMASWYGPGFHGKPTANGEIYNQHGLTAAHPYLPMDTVIRVENQANGRVVWVRVNDRGPYAKGRILDLSRAAADRLGMVKEGTAPVRIDVLRWPHHTDTELGLRAYTQYVVQLAAYPEPEKASDLLSRMQKRFSETEFMIDPRPGGVLAVVAGPFDDNRSANRVARQLQRSGVTSLVRRYRK